MITYLSLRTEKRVWIGTPPTYWVGKFFFAGILDKSG